MREGPIREIYIRALSISAMVQTIDQLLTAPLHSAIGSSSKRKKKPFTKNFTGPSTITKESKRLLLGVFVIYYHACDLSIVVIVLAAYTLEYKFNLLSGKNKLAIPIIILSTGLWVHTGLDVSLLRLDVIIILS